VEKRVVVDEEKVRKLVEHGYEGAWRYAVGIGRPLLALAFLLGLLAGVLVVRFAPHLWIWVVAADSTGALLAGTYVVGAARDAD
jgi:hypothetical protein